MSDPNDLLRRLARASALRDWAEIDAVMAEYRMAGNMRVIRGFQDAAKLQGRESPLPRLAVSDPVTIHDLTPEERSRAVIDYGVDSRGRVVGTSSFKLKAA